MEDNNKISVLVRARPLVSSEQRPAWVISNNKVLSSEHLKHQGALAQRFSFDSVYDPSITTREIYTQSVSNFAANIVEGYNCTCFAYGQSCSGKTFTIFGDCLEPNFSLSTSSEHRCPGILPLCVEDLFDRMRSTDRFFVAHFTYWELYNEELKDLLAPEKSKLEIRYTKNSMQISCVEKRVTSLDDVLVHLRSGNRLREVAATDLNTVSSRSHAIARITIESVDIALLNELVKANKLPQPGDIDRLSDYDISYRTATLTIVDLAGSERQVKTNATGDRFKEANNINKSLLTLGRVFSAITSNAAHVPYRDSNLTKILQTSLQGSCYTTMIACISLASEHIEETLSTLRYASNASSIEMKVHSNEILAENDAMIRLETERQQLMAKVKELEKRCRMLEESTGSLGCLIAESGANKPSDIEVAEPELKKTGSLSSSTNQHTQSIALSPISLNVAFTKSSQEVATSTHLPNNSTESTTSSPNLSHSIFKNPRDKVLCCESNSLVSTNIAVNKDNDHVHDDIEIILEDLSNIKNPFDEIDLHTYLDRDLDEIASCFYPENACYVQTHTSAIYRPINTLDILSLVSVDDALKQIENELEKLQKPASFLAENKQDIDEALEAQNTSLLYSTLHTIKQGIAGLQLPSSATDILTHKIIQLVSDLDQAYQYSYETSLSTALNTIGLLMEDVSVAKAQAAKSCAELETCRNTLENMYVPIEKYQALSNKVEDLTRQLALETTRVENTTTLLKQCQVTSEGMVTRLEELTAEIANVKKEKDDVIAKSIRLKTILAQAKTGIMDLKSAYISKTTALVTLKKAHAELLVKTKKLQKYKDMVVQQHQMMEALKANSAATARGTVNAGKAGVKEGRVDTAPLPVAPSQEDVDSLVDGILQEGDTVNEVACPLKSNSQEENQLLNDLLDEYT